MSVSLATVKYIIDRKFYIVRRNIERNIEEKTLEGRGFVIRNGYGVLPKITNNASINTYTSIYFQEPNRR